MLGLLVIPKPRQCLDVAEQVVYSRETLLEKLVSQYAQRPDVVRVSALPAIQHLWRHVRGSARNAAAFGRHVEPAREPEVCQLGMCFAAFVVNQEDIVQLQVAVHDTLRVDVHQ